MAEPQQGAGAKGAGRSAGARLAAKRAARAARKAAKRGTDSLIEDEVAETVERANSWLDDHQKLVWGSVAVVGVVGTVVLSLTMHSDKVGRDGAAMLWDGIDAMLAPIAQGSDTDAQPTDEDSDVLTYSSVESRAEAALAPFRETQKDYPGTDAARWARVGEANALMEEGKPAEALKAYEDAAATGSGYLKYAALEGAAFALEVQEKYAEAVKRLDAAGNAAGGVYKPVAEYQAGRLLAKAGKRDEAVKRLQAMLEAEREKADDDEAGTRPEFTSAKTDAETLLRELGAAPKGKDLNIDLGAAQPGGGGTPDMEALRKLVEAQLKNKRAAAPDPSSGEGDAPAAPAAAEATAPEEAEQPTTPEAQGSTP